MVPFFTCLLKSITRSPKDLRDRPWIKSILEDQTEGKSKFELLQVIWLSIESSIAKGNNEDSSKLLKDLISFIKGTPPSLED